MLVCSRLLIYFSICCLGQKGDPAAPPELEKIRGDIGEPGPRGLPGMDGLPGLKGMYQAGLPRSGKVY